MIAPIKMEIKRYPEAIESTSRQLKLARPHPKLTLKAKTKIPIITPEMESHVRSKEDHLKLNWSWGNLIGFNTCASIMMQKQISSMIEINVNQLNNKA